MTENDLLKELANIIFVYRKRKQLTLEDLSKRTTINSKYLRALELGKNDPQITNYLKVTKELGIPIAEIEKIINNYYRQ